MHKKNTGKKAAKTNKQVDTKIHSKENVHSKGNMHLKEKIHSKEKMDVKSNARKTTKPVHSMKSKVLYKKFSKKFCPNCGNAIEGKSTFCKNCINPDFDFKDITIILCTSCSSYLHRNKWTKFKKLDEAMSRTAKDAIKAKVAFPKMDEDAALNILENKAGIKKDITIEVKHKGQIFDIPAKLEVTLCTKCSKKGTKYFESVFQLRNSTPEILDFIRAEIKKQHVKGIFVNKEIRLDKYSDKDIDFFLTDQTYAKTLAEKVRKNFGGIIKKNAQLFSIDWETSKNKYRLNLLLEMPRYAKGDVLKTENGLFKIISIGEKVHVENLKTRSKTSLHLNNAYDILKSVIFQVIKKYPEYEVLDPNTYYQARLMNPNETLEINQKINVIIDGGEAWMV